MYIFYFLPIVPILFYLVDAYYEGDIKKGVLHILAFCFFGFIGLIMLHLIGWTFALWTPLLLLLMLSLKSRKSKTVNS